MSSNSSLPQDLLFFSNQLTGYTSNTIRIQTLSTNTLGDQGAQSCTVALPVSGVCNLKSFSMHFTASTRGVPMTGTDNNAVYALLPGVDAFIDRVGISCGGIALDNQPSNINMIQAMKDNLYKSTTKYLSDDRVLGNSTLTAINQTDSWAISNHGQKRQLIKTHWPGFLSECEPCYMDLSKVPEIRVTLQIASNTVLPVQYQGRPLGDRTPVAPNAGFTGTQCHFDLENIYFTLEMISVNGGMLEELNQRIISERGQIDVPYKQYQFFSTDLGNVGGSLRSSVSTMSLDRLYAVQRNNAPVSGGTPGVTYDPYTLQQPPVPCVDAMGTSHVIAHNNFMSKGLANWKFQVNNSPYPMYNPSPLDAYWLVVSGSGRSQSYVHGSLVGSDSCWLNNMYTSVVTLNHSDDVRLISGMNLSSINAQISYEGTSDGTATFGRQLCIVTEQTSLLRIGSSRSISVIA